jgi:hypothetical protein
MEIIPNENLPKMAECEPAIVKVQPGKVYSWCTAKTAQSSTTN